MFIPRSRNNDNASTSEPGLGDVARIQEVLAGILVSTEMGSFAHTQNLVKFPG